MSNEEEQPKMAFGEWTRGGTACPITKADERNRDWSTEVAELYDETVKDVFDIESNMGIITEAEAEEAWNQMIHILQNNQEEARRDGDEVMFEMQLSLAQRVNKQVFKDNNK